MIAGLWAYRDTLDHTYVLEDLIEINMALDIKQENERRYLAEEAARKPHA